MSDERIASIFLDTPNLWDRTFRHVKVDEPVYVVEYQYESYEYGGTYQKRHQRRYAQLRHAVRRLNFLLATQTLDKAYILGLPIDVKHYSEAARQACSTCSQCGAHDIHFSIKRAKLGA